MITATHLGLVAGALTSLAGVPQVIRVYRTKQVRDLSVWQPVLLTVGISLWLIYGIAISDIPLIVADIVSLLCSLLLLVMIFIYRNDDNGRFHDYFSRAIPAQRRRYEEPGEIGDDPVVCTHARRVRLQHHAGQRGKGICGMG